MNRQLVSWMLGAALFELGLARVLARWSEAATRIEDEELVEVDAELGLAA
jgi:hypothetical protein